MSEVKIANKNIKLISFHFDISRDVPKSFELKAKCRAKIKIPENKDNKSLLITMEVDIVTFDKNDFRISLKADALFTFNEIPEDYNEFAEHRCIPIIQEDLFTKLDKILSDMGYKKLGLMVQS